MPLYETTYILRQDVSHQEVNKFAESNKKLIESFDGKIVKLEQWGLRDLCYPINKTNKGYYTFMGIEASNEALKELERKSRLNEDVLRILTFKVDSISEDQSYLIAQDTSGDEVVIGGQKKENKVRTKTNTEAS